MVAAGQDRPRLRQILFWGYAVLFGALAVLTKIFAAALSFGNDSYFVHNFNYITFENICLFILFTLLMRWLIGKLEQKIHPEKFFATTRSDVYKITTPNQFFVVTLVATLVSFGITFLLFYPGTAMNDTITSTLNPYTSTQHPIAFQIILTNIYQFIYQLTGHLAFSVAVITGLQVLVASLIWSYVVRWLRSRHVKRGFCWLVVAFAALFPVVVSYAVCVLKDVWFAYALLLFLPTACAVLFDRKPTKMAQFLFVVAALACSLFRSNGFAVILVVLLVMFIYVLVKKMRRKLIMVVAIVTLILGQLATGAFIEARQIPQTTAKESLGVPMAQIAAVIHKYGGNVPETVISSENQAVLAQILPLEFWASEYRYSFIDTVKFHEQFNEEYFNAHVGDFLKIWAETLLKDPSLYITAYLAQTYGFWNLAFWGVDNYDTTQSVFLSYKNNIDNDWMVNYYGPEMDVSNQTRVFSDELGVTTRDYFASAVQFCFVLTAGIMIMFVLLVAIYLLVWRQGQLAILLLPLFLTWGTMMVATPASMIYRYNLYLVLALPMVVYLLFWGKKRSEARQNKKNRTTQQAKLTAVVEK